ncbi:MAG: hypothetical protein WBB39_02350 [Candidatus Saccharimonadales bacterium]
MSRAQTKKQINYILRQIGKEGLGGVTLHADSFAHALGRVAQVPPELSGKFVVELRRQQLVEVSHVDGLVTLQLSVKGIHRLQRAEIGELTIPTPSAWDGRWRMVIFDLPREHAHQRYVLTSQLRRLGFVMLRDSTWLHPYSCFDAIETVVRYCGVARFVTTAEVTCLDASSERALRRKFPDLTVRAA